MTLQSRFQKTNRKMRRIIGILSCLIVFLAFGKTSNASYEFPDNWPVAGDLDVHDPSIIKEGNTYYIFSTGHDLDGIDYPVGDFGIKVRRSYDGVNWTNVGVVFDAIPQWAFDLNVVPAESGGHIDNIWAPDISYHNGK